MPLAGDAYDIDDAWRDRVVARMPEIGIKNASQLADKMGCNRSVVSELMKRGPGAIKKSAYVAHVHAALEWPPPRSWLLSDEEIEMLDVFRALPAEQREIVRRDAARRIVTVSTPEQAPRRTAVGQMLASAVKAKTSQIEPVSSADERGEGVEGIDRSRRAGRTSRGR